MKKGLTEIVLVLDRSGSMMDIWADAVGGMKSFIGKQKEVPGEANLTLVMFDDPPFATVFDRVPIKEVDVKKLDAYHPNGTTALLKAVSDTIDDIGKKIAEENENERPERVLMVIQTDGHENASNADWKPDFPVPPKGKNWEDVAKRLNPEYKSPEPPYTKAKLKEKSDYLTKYCKWEIIYLGADSDAFDEGSSMGASTSVMYNSTHGGTQALYDSVIKSSTSYRTLGMLDEDSIGSLNDLKNKK